MMSGLCSVLDSLRQSLESDSESENDDIDADGNSSANSHIPSWHGSLQQLPTTPSTSESEAGYMSSESHLCRQCGRARRRERARASGCSSVPPGRRLRPRIKRRAHFATDTDNSSDPERLSDSHESSLLFKPIAPSPNFISKPLVSLSPREVKSVTFTSDTRPASTSSIPTGQLRLTKQDGVMSSVSLTSRLGASRAQPPPSLDIYRGRKPFKADHELFKRHPSGLPCPAPTNQRRAYASKLSSSSPTFIAPPSSSAQSSSTSGSPALPPRHPIKPNGSNNNQHQNHQHKLHCGNHQRYHHHKLQHSSRKHQHYENNVRRNSLCGGEISEHAWGSGYDTNFNEPENALWDGCNGGRSLSDNNDLGQRKHQQLSKKGPPTAPRSASASRIGSREISKSKPIMHRQLPPAPSSSPSSSPASTSSLQPYPSSSSSSPISALLLPPPPPFLLVTPPESPTSEQQPPLSPPPPELQDIGDTQLVSLSPTQVLPPPPSAYNLENQGPSPSSHVTLISKQQVVGTPPMHPSARNLSYRLTSREDNSNPPGKKLNLQETWNIARQCSKFTSDPKSKLRTDNTAYAQYSDKVDSSLDSPATSVSTHANQMFSPPKYEDAVKRKSIFHTAVNKTLSEPISENSSDSRYVGGGEDNFTGKESSIQLQTPASKFKR